MTPLERVVDSFCAPNSRSTHGLLSRRRTSKIDFFLVSCNEVGPTKQPAAGASRSRNFPVEPRPASPHAFHSLRPRTCRVTPRVGRPRAGYLAPDLRARENPGPPRAPPTICAWRRRERRPEKAKIRREDGDRAVRRKLASPLNSPPENSTEILQKFHTARGSYLSQESGIPSENGRLRPSPHSHERAREMGTYQNDKKGQTITLVGAAFRSSRKKKKKKKN